MCAASQSAAISSDRPFQSDSQLGYLYQHAEVKPPRPVIRGRYPAALAALALACLAKDPAERPTMAELAARLAAAAQARPRRWRVLWIAIAVVVALAALAIAAPSLLDPLRGD